jgi:predicted phage terminase large subunit-like protein
MADTQSLPVEGSVVAPVTRKAGRPKGSTNKPKATPTKPVVKADKRETNGGVRKQYNHTFHIPQEDLQDLQIFAPLSIKQETYLQDQEHDIVVFGGAAGAGKTQLSLLGVLLNGMYDKDYVGAIARNSQKQMKAAGSLWTTGTRMFTPYGINKNGTELTWSFPSGAEVKCHHLDDNQDDWQGTQCTEFIVDEAQQCKEDDVWYLTSRMRSKSKKKHQLRLTANPLSSSFLCDWLTRAGYLLEDGLPNPDRDGKTTYMMQCAGEFVWYSTMEECQAAHGDDAKMSLKFVFYSANVYDNPWIRKELPGYVHKLENMKTIERAKLLLGNWYAKEEGDGYIDRDWFKTVQRSDIPMGLTTIRCWDLAGTKPHEGNKNPDFTRGLKCSYDKATGMFYIHHMASMRDTSAMVETLIQQTAVNDGNECFIGIPVDPGAAGKLVADTKRARLASNGFKCIQMNTRGSKLQRAEPFLVALQDGRVHVADGVFTKEHYIELESFDGAKCGGQHDDIVDALADCWNALTGNKLIPTIHIGAGAAGVRRQLGGNTLLTKR